MRGNKANLPAEEAPTTACARLPKADVHVDGAPGYPATSSEGPSPSHRLARPKPRDRRLSRQADFTHVFRQGRHDSARLLAVRSAPNELGWSRFAYTVSKRVAKSAVVRNRIRRRLREAVRSLPFAEGYDVVIVVRPPAVESDFHRLRAELTLLLRRAKLLPPG